MKNRYRTVLVWIFIQINQERIKKKETASGGSET